MLSPIVVIESKGVMHMALVQPVMSQLRLVLYDGEDPSTGQARFRNKNFNAVKPEATAEELHSIAVALASLQERPLQTVERIDRAEIHEA